MWDCRRGLQCNDVPGIPRPREHQASGNHCLRLPASFASRPCRMFGLAIQFKLLPADVYMVYTNSRAEQQYTWQVLAGPPPSLAQFTGFVRMSLGTVVTRWAAQSGGRLQPPVCGRATSFDMTCQDRTVTKESTRPRLALLAAATPHHSLSHPCPARARYRRQPPFARAGHEQVAERGPARGARVPL